MTSICVAWMLCSGPPVDATSESARALRDRSLVVSLPVDECSAPAELHSACTAAIRHSASRRKPDPAAVVPELVALYQVVGEAEQLGPAARKRLQDRLRTRMEQIREELLRVLSRAKKANRNRRASADSERLSAGPAAPGVQSLIDLIQTTVAPSAWEVNGGLGTIHYLPRYQVLVIRQSQAAHSKIGGALQVLRN